MKTDAKIMEDVLQELAWQLGVDKTQIGVIVKDGVVTLTGVVDSYTKKIAAERAAKSVYGVKAVAEDIEVKYSAEKGKTDTEIAKAVVEAFEWNTAIPEEDIKIKVEDGWVYLNGEVKWAYQRTAAKNIVEKLYGVKGVINSITIKQLVKPEEVKDRIVKALERSADLEAKNIHVDVDGHTVTLTGTVHSLNEKDEARKAAFYAPGVSKVVNKLEVTFYPEYA